MSLAQPQSLATCKDLTQTMPLNNAGAKKDIHGADMDDDDDIAAIVSSISSSSSTSSSSSNNKTNHCSSLATTIDSGCGCSIARSSILSNQSSSTAGDYSPTSGVGFSSTVVAAAVAASAADETASTTNSSSSSATNILFGSACDEVSATAPTSANLANMASSSTSTNSLETVKKCNGNGNSNNSSNSSNCDDDHMFQHELNVVVANDDEEEKKRVKMLCQKIYSNVANNKLLCRLPPPMPLQPLPQQFQAKKSNYGAKRSNKILTVLFDYETPNNQNKSAFSVRQGEQVKVYYKHHSIFIYN